MPGSRPSCRHLTIYMRRIAFIWFLLLVGFPLTAARADSIPPELEMAIHLKILSFDSGLKERATASTISIAILHPADRKGAASDVVTAVAGLSEKGVTVHGKKVRAVAIPISADLADRLSGISVLYIIDDVGSDTVSAIARIAVSRKLPLLSGDRSYLASGGAVAVVEKNNKPGIVVHAGNAKECGMVLDSKLLRLAEVIK